MCYTSHNVKKGEDMYYFIVNPNAGGGKGAARWEKIRRQLDKSGLRYEAMLTQRRGDARDFARQLAEYSTGSNVVVAVGGDGTMNEVIDGLVFDGTVTLAYIPTGVHNSLSRCLSLPKNTRKYLKNIQNQQNYRVIDYGVLSYGKDVPQHRRFAIACGIGLGAAIYGRLDETEKKRRFLPFSRVSSPYLLRGLSELYRSDPVKGYILLDGVKKIEFNRIFLITARIYSREKKHFLKRRKASATDAGTMEVYIIHGTSKLKLLPIFADAWRNGSTQHSGVRRYTCRDLEIHVDVPMPVHVDGELCQRQNDITLSCVKKKIRMIV